MRVERELREYASSLTQPERMNGASIIILSGSSGQVRTWMYAKWPRSRVRHRAGERAEAARSGMKRRFPHPVFASLLGVDTARGIRLHSGACGRSYLLLHICLKPGQRSIKSHRAGPVESMGERGLLSHGLLHNLRPAFHMLVEHPPGFGFSAAGQRRLCGIKSSPSRPLALRSSKGAAEAIGLASQSR